MNYTYDALNRLLDTTYSTARRGIGHRWITLLGRGFQLSHRRFVDSSRRSINNFTSYDALGRVERPCSAIPEWPHARLHRHYDQLGDLTACVYPRNNLTVTYGYDTAAPLTSASDSNGVTYATSPTFFASGSDEGVRQPNFNNNKFHTG